MQAAITNLAKRQPINYNARGSACGGGGGDDDAALHAQADHPSATAHAPLCSSAESRNRPWYVDPRGKFN